MIENKEKLFDLDKGESYPEDMSFFKCDNFLSDWIITKARFSEPDSVGGFSLAPNPKIMGLNGGLAQTADDIWIQ